MRGLAAAMFFCVAGPAICAEPSVTVDRGLARFEQICAAAISNPQAYVETIPNPDALGSKTVSVSPDGQVVMTSFVRDGLIEDVLFLRLPGSLTVHCAVHEDQTSPESAINQFATEEAMAAHTQALAQAFEARMAGRTGVTLVGGNIPLEMASVYGGVVHRGAIPYNYRYGFHLDVEGLTIPSLVEIAYANAAFQTIHRIEVPE